MNEDNLLLFKVVDKDDYNKLAKLKREIIPNSIIYSSISVLLFEFSRMVYKKANLFYNPFELKLNSNSKSIRNKYISYFRYFSMFLGVSISFSYFTMKYSEERFTQILKYNDVLSEYLDYKEGKIHQLTN